MGKLSLMPIVYLAGGSFVRMAIKWLDWQLKQKNENAKVFLNNKLAQFPSWTMKAKNF